MNDRKKDHIQLARKSFIDGATCDLRFNYEPLLSAHTDSLENTLETKFLGKKLKAPIWISSITGGTSDAKKINHNLASVAGKFGLGFALGSCRPLLEDDECFTDFNVRPLLGSDSPLFANLGIAQVEKILLSGEIKKIEQMVARLTADGLIIHVNPLQEAFQPEGDRFERAPIETIEEFLSSSSIPLIVKEVGQGMGPKSLERLMKLPLAAIEFGAFGGTNFSKLELLRGVNKSVNDLQELVLVGHTASEMVKIVNSIRASKPSEIRCLDYIISGGVNSFLDGHYLIEKLEGSAIYGQAINFLEHASDLDELTKYVETQIYGLTLARKFLTIK